MTNWNEEDHPRVPGGRVNGGQFTDKKTMKGRFAPGKKAGSESQPYEDYASAYLDEANKEAFYIFLDGMTQNYLGGAL